MEKVGKIYLITNDINNKVYIGQTIQSLKKRFSGHCCYSKSDRSVNMYIKRAIHKYGRDHFKISLLEICKIEDLDNREKYWIAKYNSYNTGYNLTEGGQSSNYFNIHKLENKIDIKKFKDYIKEFTPLAIEVANHFGICKSSVYNLIKRLNDPTLILNSYNPRKAKEIIEKNGKEIIELYLSGWSILDLVKKFRIRKFKISRFLKFNNIKVHRGYRGYVRRI